MVDALNKIRTFAYMSIREILEKASFKVMTERMIEIDEAGHDGCDIEFNYDDEIRDGFSVAFTVEDVFVHFDYWSWGFYSTIVVEVNGKSFGNNLAVFTIIGDDDGTELKPDEGYWKTTGSISDLEEKFLEKVENTGYWPEDSGDFQDFRSAVMVIQKKLLEEF